MTTLAVLSLLVIAGVAWARNRTPAAPAGSPTGADGATAATAGTTTTATSRPNVYAATGVGMMSPAVAGMPYRIYVPESAGSEVDVIDPATMTIVEHYRTGLDPQHVVPSWDLKTLYATNTLANTITPIDPFTAKPKGPAIGVDDPYNMYFTVDGSSAIVVAEARQRLDFRDPQTFALQHSLPVACPGVDHVDFSADGSYLIATCEFSARLVKVDVASRTVVGYLDLKGSSPQDIKLDPEGRIFYVADKNLARVHLIDGATFTEVGFLPTGPDSHGLYPSRDGRQLYVSNRGSGTITVVDFATRSVVATWTIPGGGSPDMGGVSPDGRVLWLSGRYHKTVYAIDTTTGQVIGRVPVGDKPHGLAVWPQPGRFSLGHTGVLR